MDVPEEVAEIWNRYGLDEQVRKHCIKVAEVALRIAKRINTQLGAKVDENAVKLGALLHDIGRALTHNAFKHFVVSGEILRKEKFDERIAFIAERHFAAGLTKEEAKMLGLPEKDYLPLTIEEKIVCHADNVVMGDREVEFDEFLRRLDRVSNFEWLKNATKKRAIKLKEEIEHLIGI